MGSLKCWKIKTLAMNFDRICDDIAPPDDPYNVQNALSIENHWTQSTDMLPKYLYHKFIMNKCMSKHLTFRLSCFSNIMRFQHQKKQFEVVKLNRFRTQIESVFFSGVTWFYNLRRQKWSMVERASFIVIQPLNRLGVNNLRWYEFKLHPIAIWNHTPQMKDSQL